MRIAIVSENPMLLKSLDLMLSDPSLGATVVEAGAQPAGQRGRSGGVDLVLLDADVPEARRKSVRRDVGTVPVIVIVGADRADDPLPGFEGCDHLVSPFHRQDLVNRVHAALDGKAGARRRLRKVGPLTLDLASRTATVNGEPLPLTAKEYEVLAFLVTRKGVTLTKDMFLDRLYGGIDEPEVKIIDVFICKIRRKIKALTGGDPLIETVWGRGYVLRDPEASEDAGEDAGGVGAAPVKRVKSAAG